MSFFFWFSFSLFLSPFCFISFFGPLFYCTSTQYSVKCETIQTTGRDIYRAAKFSFKELFYWLLLLLGPHGTRVLVRDVGVHFSWGNRGGFDTGIEHKRWCVCVCVGERGGGGSHPQLMAILTSSPKTLGRLQSVQRGRPRTKKHIF